MSINERQREQMLTFCDQLHEDDGIDPREWFKDPHNRNKRDHRTQRLCSQVGETIDLVLSGEFDDELLHNLRVVRVTPAPDSSRLLVLLQPDISPEMATLEQIRHRLARVAGRLRSEVAAAITRKRAPQLIFHIDREEEHRTV